LEQNGLPMISLVRAIQKRYGVKAKETAIRVVVRELLRNGQK
jgi:hypothetical protein